MQALKQRSGSSDMVHKAKSDSPDSKLSKGMERKSSIKSMSVPEKRILRVSEMQQQLVPLQEELKKAKEERSQALAELREARKSERNENERAEIAKESERRMLESLVSQTKQLEQSKMMLEEAKLELRTLQDSTNSFQGTARHSSRNLGKHLEANGSDDLARAQEEIKDLRNELKLATAAEEKAKKAMDDLAIALQEVATDANRTKGRLLNTQSELKSVKAEAGRLEDLLKMTDQKFRASVEESERVKMELEKSQAAWMAKENGFVDCMKVSEEEMSKARDENDRLISSQRMLREDNSKLRDILKHAVNEATVVKEAMEIARKENSTLKDILVDKDNSLQRLRQDYGCLKVSEAAAIDSVRELKSLLAATSIVRSSRSGEQSKAVSASSMDNNMLEQPKVDTARSMENYPIEQPKVMSTRWMENKTIENLKAGSAGTTENGLSEEPIAASTEVNGRTDKTKFPSGNCNGFSDQPKAASTEVNGCKDRAKFTSGNWNTDKPRVQKGRRYSVGEENTFTGSFSDSEEVPEPKERKLKCVSNMTELRVPSSLFEDDGKSTYYDEFDHIDRNQLAGMEQYDGSLMKQKKKKPILRRFGDMIRRRSFHK